MRHSFTFARFVLTCLAAGVVLISGLRAESGVAAGPGASGGGVVNATDIDSGYFARAATLSLTASTGPGGEASGVFSLVGRGDFATAWGACPFDPRCEPDTSTKTLKLQGEVTGITSLGDTVEISGTLTETDHGKGNGVIFEELNVPFVITATEGSQTFVLQFCEVPPFTMDMATGNLSVHAGAPVALLNRPQAVATRPSCH
jgi:hypothetical protein